MQRFYVSGLPAGSAGEVALPDHVARQIATVLRMRPGDRIVLFDGSGPEWEAELVDLSRGGTRARLLSRIEPAREAARRVILCQALLKGEKMEWVLQKATELGVAAVQPLLTERVVAQKAGTPERWRRILIEAAEQSGRTRLPALPEPVALRQALSTGGASVFCWEEEQSLDLADHLRSLGQGELRLFVGPEGGFSAAEADQARAAGAVSVSLGPRILRAETAAIAATTLALLGT